MADVVGTNSGLSWSDPYSACSSSYNTSGATFDFACASPQLVYSDGEDMNLLDGDDASEFFATVWRMQPTGDAS
jgi:hypothetical protein